MGPMEPNPLSLTAIAIQPKKNKTASHRTQLIPLSPCFRGQKPPGRMEDPLPSVVVPEEEQPQNPL